MHANPANEIAQLRRQIEHHDRKYYVEAAPEISDLEYDRLMDRLKRLEAEHPELITPDSPTQRVGDQPVEGLVEVPHRVPMLSIDNTYSIDELRAYGRRTEKLPRRRTDRMGGRTENRRCGRIAPLRRRPDWCAASPGATVRSETISLTLCARSATCRCGWPGTMSPDVLEVRGRSLHDQLRTWSA